MTVRFINNAKFSHSWCSSRLLTISSWRRAVMTGHTIGFALGLFVAVNGYTLPPLHVWSGYKLSPHDRIVLCADAEAVKAPDMRVKELKEELDNRGVSWRGVAFEKAELVNLLEDARNAPPAPPPAPEPEPAAAEPTAAEQTTTAPADDSAKYDEAYTAALAEAKKLKVKELRTELASRNVGWADLFEKEELAARLAGLKAQAVFFSASGALSPGAVGMVDGDQCLAELADTRTPMILDVYATWCGPCKMIAPMLESIAAKAGDRLRIAKMDSDEEQELSTELKVAGLPTLIFVKGGEEVHRLEGVPGNEAALAGLVSQYLGVQV